jgi:NADH-quinone oxidoreductase subunit J
MTYFIFIIAATGAIAGAIGVVALRDPFYSVLALVCHLIALSVLFLLLRAELLAAVQVVVYAGAVMVLYVFVVAYVGDEEATLAERLRGGGAIGSGLRRAAALVGAALLAELLIALLGSGLKAVETSGAAYHGGPRAFGTPAYIGNLLLTHFLLAFEIASFLLLVAAVGAVVLAGRVATGRPHRGPAGHAEHPQEMPPGEGPSHAGAEPAGTRARSPQTGTLAEAGAGIETGARAEGAARLPEGRAAGAPPVLSGGRMEARA